jgi:hypothetical protein
MPNFAEQDLLLSLTDEAMAAFGMDMYYVPRVLGAVDTVYGNDPSSSYVNAFQIVTYLESVEGFGGDKDFIAKFAGLEIQDALNFTVSQRMFADIVGSVTGQVRPNEGDIVFFPFNHRCFQITFVEKFSMMYPLGVLPVWSLRAELFEYSNEVFKTGIPDIDRIAEKTQDTMKTSITDTQGNFLETEKGSIVSSKDETVPDDDTKETVKEADAIIHWNPNDPFEEGS